MDSWAPNCRDFESGDDSQVTSKVCILNKLPGNADDADPQTPGFSNFNLRKLSWRSCYNEEPNSLDVGLSLRFFICTRFPHDSDATMLLIIRPHLEQQSRSVRFLLLANKSISD